MIGGEFEIDLRTQRDSFVPQSNMYYYASGRAALYQIFKSIGNKVHKVWFPDYLCHTMVEAACKADFEYDFYELDENFLATVGALDAKGFGDGCLVLIVNYFGLQDLIPIAKEIKAAWPHAIVIEDDVQSYFCFAEEANPYADFRFTSLRKTFAVPDGGIVYTNQLMQEATRPNTFVKYKIDGGVLKLRRGQPGIKDDDYLSLFEKGLKLIDENYDSGMSRDSQMLFAGTDIHCVKRQRRENATYLLEGLHQLGIRPLIDVHADKIPLFIPIYLEKRDDVRRRLFSHEVFCPVHWPLQDLPLKKGAEMARHELSLIVDQRYTKEDMDLIFSLLI